MSTEYTADTVVDTYFEGIVPQGTWVLPELSVAIGSNVGTDFRPENETGNVVVCGRVVVKDFDVLVAIADQAERKLKQQQEMVLAHVQVMIQKAPFSPRWKTDGVTPPTAECRELSFSYASGVYGQVGIIPYRVACSIEEGMMLTYWNEDNGKILRIEVYNTQEIVGSVSQGSDILYCEALDNASDRARLLELFAE